MKKYFWENMPRISNSDVVLSFALRLYEAIEHNNLDNVQDLILRKGANPNLVIPGKGVSPFHLAVGIDTADFSEEVTKLFLRYGGNPNVRSCEGLTPVHVASIRGCSASLHLLLLAGGDPEALDDDDYSPLYYAHLEGHLCCAELLQTFKSIKRKFYVKSLLDKNNETKIIPRNYKIFKNHILKINDNDLLSECSNASEEYNVDLNISSCFNQYIIEEEDANHSEKVKLNKTYLSRDAKNESLEPPTNYLKFTPIANSTWNFSQSDNEIISNQLINNSHYSESMELGNCEDNIQNKTFLKIDEKYDNLFGKHDNESHLQNDKICNNEEYCEIDQNKEIDLNDSGKINNETFSKNSSPLNTFIASHLTFEIANSKSDTYLLSDICDYSIMPSGRPPLQKELNVPVQTLNTNSNLSLFSKSLGEKTKEFIHRRKCESTINVDDSTISPVNQSKDEFYPVLPEEKNNCTEEEIILLKRELQRTFRCGVPVNLNKTWIKELPIEDSDIRSNHGMPKEIYDLSFSNTYNAQIEESSDVSEECEKELETNGYINQCAIGVTNENTFDAAQIDSVCLGTISSTIFCKEKNVTNDSIKMSNDFSKFTPVANSTQILGQSEDGINKTWLASNSCFSETNELKNCLEKKATDSENGEIEVISDSKFLESYVKGCDEEKYEEIDFNEDNNFNECSKINDETFTRDSSSSISPLPLHLTYDMSDWSPDTMLTYNICDYSIISSDRSSPIQNESNTSGKPSNIYKRYSKSTLSLVSENFREQTKYVTHRKKGLLNINFVESTISSTNCSESEDYFTVPEEMYQYTDEEEGVVLLEKRLPPVVHPNLSTISNNAPDDESDIEDSERRNSSVSSLSTCDTEVLRKEIYDAVSSGCCCPLGPITATTKRVYRRKIHRFKKSMKDNCTPQSSKKTISVIPKFSRELEKMLANPQSLDRSKYIDIEQRMMAQFDGHHKPNRWREGGQKSSFNYLLLDPRVTCNLSLRWANDDTMAKGSCSEENRQYWRDFLCAIFYIGKGKRSRPYAHLYEAFNIWRNGGPVNKSSKKIKHILDIWKENLGVVCLHVFQNSIPVEAFTREAAMIDAIGLNNLKNEQRGEYYGVVSSLGFSQKREFGSFLLNRALFIFLNDGERQIRPADIY